METAISEMTAQDYDDVLTLWQVAEGVGLSRSDSREGIARFLQHNPGLSFVARDEGVLVGAILCGHDGRRGYIHHLAVHPAHRRQGLGRTLAELCLSRLKAMGIDKCHLFVFVDNEGAIAFWKDVRWTCRTDLTVMSRFTADAPG
jgi:putative acetyltransferase